VILKYRSSIVPAPPGGPVVRRSSVVAIHPPFARGPADRGKERPAGPHQYSRSVEMGQQ
jgi:hypothetical protein